MPVGPPTYQSTIPWQVLPANTQPFVQQMNFGQMIGEVLFWNPNVQAKAPVWVNESVRKVYDRRTWFGCFVKGQLVCPPSVTQGQATVTTGSPLVTGTGTNWDASIIGRQFRIGYNNPIYTITDVDPIGQTLLLELDWGGTSATQSGYFIVQYYYNLGPNIKYLKLMVNMQLGYKFRTGWTQDTLNSIDPWRQNQNFPWAVAPMPTDPSGNYLVELYPASWIQQAFPFMVYVQPPNLVKDTDSLPPYIRTDVIVKDAIAKAILMSDRPDRITMAAMFMKEFEEEVGNMAQADENLYLIDFTKFGEDLPYYNPGGALWDAQHAVMGNNAAYGGGSWG